MGIKHRIERLEHRQHIEDTIHRPRLSGDDILWSRFGLDPNKLRAEQAEQTGQDGQLSLMEILAGEIGISFAEFKAFLQTKARE